MEHTFLFQEGRWVANGNYSDEKNSRRPATGSTMIEHTERGWINAGSMMMLASTGLVTFENRYEITPFKEGEEFTHFTAENPALGTLSGTLMLAGDSILAVSTSEDGSTIAVESLRMIDDRYYENRGFALKEGRKVGSWELELRKE
jgi:hypothetical protein